MLSGEKARKNQLLVQICMMGLIFLCLLPVIMKPYVWYDESFTVNLVRKPIPELLRITALDVHPPLYYLVVKLFVTVLGDHLWVYHLPSLLSYLLLLLLTCMFFSKYFDAFTSLLVTAAFCSMPNMIKHALELRMYSMSMLLIAAGMYVSYYIMSQADDMGRPSRHTLKPWILLALVNVSAAYTHYFAGVAAVGISLFLLLFLLLKYGRHAGSRLVCWGIYVGIMVVLYLPWLPTLLSQMSAVDQQYWIGPLTEAALHECPEILFLIQSDFMQMALKVFFLVGMFLLVSGFSRNRRFFWVTGCLIVIGFWMMFSILYSLLISPIFVDRYLVMLLPLVWIPVTVSYRDRPSHVHTMLFILFAVCFIQTYNEQYNVYSSSSDIQLVEFGKEHIQPEDAFFHFYITDLSVCNVYFPENEHYIYSSSLEPEPALSAMIDCNGIDSYGELPVSRNIWCLNSDYSKTFLESGFQVEPFKMGTREIYRIYKEESGK